MNQRITDEILKSQGWSNTFVDRFWKKVDKLGPTHYGLSPCWLWTGSIQNGRQGGYGIILTRSPGHKMIKTHRASWIIHNGPIPNGQFVLHKCDVRNCVNPDHLFLGRHIDNARDKISKGRGHYDHGHYCTGEQCNFAKLSWDIVERIRSEYKPYKVTLKELGARYNVHPMNIYLIVHFKTWTHKALTT